MEILMNYEYVRIYEEATVAYLKELRKTTKGVRIGF
jgi:hypothetical protein